MAKRIILGFFVALAGLLALGAASDKINISQVSGGAWVVQVNISGTKTTVLSVSGTGQVTIGTGTSSLKHIIYGQASNGSITELTPSLEIESSTSGSNATFGFYTDESNSQVLLKAATAGGTGGAAVGFYSNTNHTGSIDSSGNWSLGAGGNVFAIKTSLQNPTNGGIALYGTNHATNVTINPSSTVTFTTTSQSSCGGLLILYEGAGGTGAIYAVANGTLTQIANNGSVFTTSAPSSTQIRVTATGSTVSLTGGSSQTDSVFVNAIINDM